MKTRIPLFLTLLFIVSSCSDNECLEDMDSPLFLSETMTRSTSTTNASLIDKWENISQITLNDGSTKVTAPWSDGAPTALPEDFCKDIKKEDGWEMLFHTFANSSESQYRNYICFYNQFTGKLKFFYYYPGTTTTQQVMWHLKASNNSNSHLFDDVNYLSEPLSASAKNSSIGVTNHVNSSLTGLYKGWNGFEFYVPYTTDIKGRQFTITADNKTITNYSFAGSASFSTCGEFSIKSTGETSSGISSALAQIGGDQAKDWLNKLTSSSKLSSSLKSLINSVSSSGSIVSALTSGLNLIFGKSTVVDNKEGSIDLSTSGTINVTGTSSTSNVADVEPITFNLYDIMNEKSSIPDDMVTSSTTYSGRYIGTWSLSDYPKATYTRVLPVTITSKTSTQIVGGTYYPRGSASASVTINPSLSSYLKSSSFTFTSLLCDSLDGSKYLPGVKDAFDGNGSEFLYSDGKIKICRVCQGKSVQVKSSLTSSTSSSYLFDWGELIFNGRHLVVVTADLTFEYSGKTTVIQQTRVYKVGTYTTSDTSFNPDNLSGSGICILTPSNSSLQ